MGRIERRLFHLADQLRGLDEEEQLVASELEYHRHLADDARRDAVVSGARADALEAGATEADVARFERRLREIARRRSKLENTRAKLLSRLD